MQGLSTRPGFVAVAGAVIAFVAVLAVYAVGGVGSVDAATTLTTGGWFAGAVGIGLFVVLVTVRGAETDG